MSDATQSLPTQHLGRYEILQELGHGAMGKVYLGLDPRIGRQVALKTIAVEGATEADREEDLQRFFREAKAAGKLTHAGIVQVYDMGEDEVTQTPFIVMEYVQGNTLDELMKEGCLTLDIGLEIVRQVAEALDFAHGQGIVHRDVKPANILVGDDGRAKITDFGLARVHESKLTRPGQALGTPSHMAPEQLRGEPVTGQSDIFSLGVVLYTVLTGEKPFSANTVSEVVLQVAYQDPQAVTAKNPSLRPEFDYVVARALAKDPARRYKHAQDLADDIHDLKEGKPIRWLAGTAALSPKADVSRLSGVLLNTSNPDTTMAAAPPTFTSAAAVPAHSPGTPAASAAPAPTAPTITRPAPESAADSTQVGAPTPPKIAPVHIPAPRRRRWTMILPPIVAVIALAVAFLAFKGGLIHRAQAPMTELHLAISGAPSGATFSLALDGQELLTGEIERKKGPQPSVNIRAGRHHIAVRVKGKELEASGDADFDVPEGTGSTLEASVHRVTKVVDLRLR